MGLKDIFASFGKRTPTVKDPICGMSVNPETAAYKSTYQGKTYAFCSPSCKATFDENPKQYAG